MLIHKMDSGLLHSCCYIIEENGRAIVIDPCKDTGASERFIIDYLIVTHEHYDHISGVNEWKEATGAPLLCSSACAVNLPNPKKNMSHLFDVFCQLQTWMPTEGMDIHPVEYRCEADRTFDDEMTLDWQGHLLMLSVTPGHSAGGILINLDGTDYFTGDSLMENCVVELRMPGGSAKQWEAIGRQRIEAIPEGARIWPGHFGGFIYHRPSQI